MSLVQAYIQQEVLWIEETVSKTVQNYLFKYVFLKIISSKLLYYFFFALDVHNQIAGMKTNNIIVAQLFISHFKSVPDCIAHTMAYILGLIQHGGQVMPNKA